MLCEFCKTDYKHEFLSKRKFDEGETSIICNSCEERLKLNCERQGEGK
jgi:hypothetical protein